MTQEQKEKIREEFLKKFHPFIAYKVGGQSVDFSPESSIGIVEQFNEKQWEDRWLPVILLLFGLITSGVGFYTGYLIYHPASKEDSTITSPPIVYSTTTVSVFKEYIDCKYTGGVFRIEPEYFDSGLVPATNFKIYCIVSSDKDMPDGTHVHIDKTLFDYKLE